MPDFIANNLFILNTHTIKMQKIAHFKLQMIFYTVNKWNETI